MSILEHVEVGIFFSTTVSFNTDIA